MASQLLTPVSLCSLTTNNILSLAAAVGAPVLLGYLAGSHVRKFKSLYYRDVEKPRFMPPSSLFAPIWTVMYSLMGYASYLIYQTGQVNNVSVVRPLAYYGVQLAFNLCWPALFFRYRNVKVALYIVTANLILGGITTFKFGQVNPEAAQLMVPYLGWLVVAGYTNKLIWRKNQSNSLLSKSKLFTYPSNEMVAKADLQLAMDNCTSVKKE